MSLGEVLVIFFVLAYGRYVVGLFNKNNRKKIIKLNTELDVLRKIPVKTLEDQKRFIALKYPEGKFKWSWRFLPQILLSTAIFIVLYKLLIVVEGIYGFEVKLWQGVLLLIVGPIVVNMILKKFKIQKI